MTSPDQSQSNPPAAPVESLTFEAAQAELERIVEQLESPGTGLEQAIGLWERGEALHAHCAAKLDAALHRIERIELAAEDVQAEAQQDTADAFEPEPTTPTPSTADSVESEVSAPAPPADSPASIF